MQDLLPRAERLAAILKERRETIVVADHRPAGPDSGCVAQRTGRFGIFPWRRRRLYAAGAGALLDIQDAAVAGMRGASEPYALLMARTARERFSATWGLAESGATGPTGNRYGDAADQPASRSGRSSGLSPWRPQAAIVSPACAPSPPRRWISCRRASPPRLIRDPERRQGRRSPVECTWGRARAFSH